MTEVVVARDEAAAARRHCAGAAVSSLIAVLSVIGIVGLRGALSGGPTSRTAAVFESPVLPALLLSMTGIVVALFATAAHRLNAARRWLFAFALTLALAIASVELRQTYRPASGNDFPHAFAAFHARNFNLTESLMMAQNLLRGKGNTLPVADGSTKINTYRMPGYSLFVAAAGRLSGVSADDLAGLGASTVYAQVWFFAVAVAFMAYRLSESIPVWAAALAAAGTCWFPQLFDITSADAVVASCGLLVAGSLCRFHRDRDASKVPLRDHLLVHAAFALWFLMRSDVLPGWLGISGFLYWRQPRYLLLPLAFFVSLGSIWGLYKKSHGSEFVMTTSNIGHVAFVGLWQTLPHRFVWEPSDEAYAGWVGAHGYTYMEPRANAFAIREVVRFWLTYPGFALGNVCYKVYSHFRYHAWWGGLALYPTRLVGVVMRNGAYLVLFAAFVFALCVRFEARRVFLLGWPALLNLPLFLVLQHNARYVGFVNVSLMLAGICVLLDPRFYRSVSTVRRQVLIWGTVAALWLSAPLIMRTLFADPIRYWTPLLDPSASTLNMLR